MSHELLSDLRLKILGNKEIARKFMKFLDVVVIKKANLHDNIQDCSLPKTCYCLSSIFSYTSRIWSCPRIFETDV